MRRLESSDSGPKALERDKRLDDVAIMAAFCGGDRLAPSLSSSACCESSPSLMFLYSFLSEPVDLVVYRSQPPVTLQSGVLKLRAPVTVSNAGTGRY